MATAPGADERRARALLIRALNGTATSTAPVAPAERARDWLDDILDAPPAPAPAAAPRLPDWRKGETADLSGQHPDRPDTLDIAEPDEDEDRWEGVDEPTVKARPAARRPLTPAARRAHTAYTGLPGRARTVLYTGTAAGAGHALGLAPLFESWITGCGHDTTNSGAVALGVGLILATGVLIDRRTRHWWGPLPWLCRIPLASALLALALYAPGVTP